VEEAARLLGKHPQTVREWTKAGLPTVDERRPILIRGCDLRAFLEARSASRRSPCPPGTLYCFRCRQPRPPAFGEADFKPRDRGAGNLSALCEACGGVMNRRTNLDRIAEILPGLRVRVLAGAAAHS
jgi:hypothetical protein